MQHLAAGREHDDPALLPGVAFDRSLPVAAQRGAGKRERARGAKRRRDGTSESERRVSRQLRVGVDVELGDVALTETARVSDAPAADDHERGAGRLDVTPPATQLRGAFLAVRSTEVAQERDHHGPVRRQRAQLARLPVEVEDCESGRELLHNHIVPEYTRAAMSAASAVRAGGRRSGFGWLRHLGLSAGWFGFNFHWLPIPLVLVPNQVLSLVPHSEIGTGIAIITASGAVFATLVPPFVGHWSDRLTTRWGRRRPILVAGTLGDVVGLALLGTAHSYGQLIAGYVMIQFFYNAAGAAYNGIIPDVVPDEEFGTASGWLGAMNQFGGVVGVGVASVLAGFGHANWTYGVIAIVVVVTLIPVLIAARGEGLMPLPRRPRMSAGDSIREFVRPLGRGDFAWVIFTRLMVTAGVWVVANFLLPFFHDVARVPNAAEFTALFLAIVYLTATPTGFLGGAASDRLGRKVFVYASGAFQAAVALVFIVFYPTAVPVLIALGAVYGLGFGLYYAVDWALACDTLPDRDRAAKDMGLFHVAFTLPQVVVPSVAGPVLDYFNHSSANSGYRVIFSAAVVFMVLGSFFVSRIRSVR